MGFRGNASKVLLTTTLVGTGFSASAYAQDPPARASTPTQASVPEQVPANASGVEDIVVTARKTAESQQSVPVAITALSQAGLQRQAVLSVQDLQTAVPGLFVAPNSQGGAPTFAIRAAKADNGTSATVTTYINDMPTTTTRAVANMIYDMQSVTTLKGPQGTLFGSNSTGGAIIFHPNAPTSRFEGYLKAGLGSFNRREIEGVINVPASDLLQFRLAGNLVRRDGFVTNRASDAQRGAASTELSDDRHESARLSVRFTPSAALQNDLLVNYFHEQDRPYQAINVAVRPRFAYSTFLGFAVPVDYARAGLRPSPDTRNVELGSDPTYNIARIWDVTNSTTISVARGISAKLALGFEHANLDTFENNAGLVGEIVNGRSKDVLRQYTIEPSLDYVGGDGRLHVKLGGFYSKTRRETGNSYGVIGLPFDLTGYPPAAVGAVNAFLPLLSAASYRRNLDSKAIYAQGSVDLTHTLIATLGARYTWDKGRYAAHNYNGFGAAVTSAHIGEFDNASGVLVCTRGLATYKDFDPATCTGHQDYKTSAPSFTAGLEKKFGPHTMGYITARTGYLVGGFNNQVYVPGGFAQVFRPEKVVDGELGLKSDWHLLGRPIRTNIDVFMGRYRDQQRVQNGTTPFGGGFIAVQNAGRSKYYGADLELAYSPTSQIDLSVNYQYIHATYVEFKAPINIPGVPNAFVDFKGRRESQTPDHVINLSGTYKVPLSPERGRLSATVSYFWRSKTTAHDAPTVSGPTLPSGELQTITQDYTAFDKLRSFGLLNMTVSWASMLGSRIDLQLYGKNLINNKYPVYGSNQLLQYGYATYTYGAPREIGANLRYNF